MDIDSATILLKSMSNVAKCLNVRLHVLLITLVSFNHISFLQQCQDFIWTIFLNNNKRNRYHNSYYESSSLLLPIMPFSFLTSQRQTDLYSKPATYILYRPP